MHHRYNKRALLAMLAALLLCLAIPAGASEVQTYPSKFIKNADLNLSLLSSSEEYRSLFAVSLFAEISQTELNTAFTENMGKSDSFGGIYYVELENNHGIMMKFGSPAEVWSIYYSPGLETIGVIINTDIAVDLLPLMDKLVENGNLTLYQSISLPDMLKFLQKLKD